jgi:hypothetical protein
MAQAPSVADLTHSLQGLNFPAGKADLKQQAEGNKAPDEIISAIDNLPEDNFGTMADVMRAYGEEDTSKISGKEHEAATEAARKGGSR